MYKQQVSNSNSWQIFRAYILPELLNERYDKYLAAEIKVLPATFEDCVVLDPRIIIKQHTNDLSCLLLIFLVIAMFERGFWVIKAEGL